VWQSQKPKLHELALVDRPKDSTLDAAAAAPDVSRCVLSLVLCAALDASINSSARALKV